MVLFQYSRDIDKIWQVLTLLTGRVLTRATMNFDLLMLTQLRTSRKSSMGFLITWSLGKMLGKDWHSNKVKKHHQLNILWCFVLSQQKVAWISQHSKTVFGQWLNKPSQAELACQDEDLSLNQFSSWRFTSKTWFGPIGLFPNPSPWSPQPEGEPIGIVKWASPMRRKNVRGDMACVFIAAKKDLWEQPAQQNQRIRGTSSEWNAYTHNQ